MQTVLFELNEVIAFVYTVSGKKGATLFLPVTPRNANRFSKFLHCHALQ